MMIHPDDFGFTYSTDAEWDRAEAREIGEMYPDHAWICTDRDVWHRNPFYQGPPVRHPEDDSDDDDPDCFSPAPAPRFIADVLPDEEIPF